MVAPAHHGRSESARPDFVNGLVRVTPLTLTVGSTSQVTLQAMSLTVMD
jgi:hypothetical protein